MPTGTYVPRRANSVLVGFKDVPCFVEQILIDRSLKDVPKIAVKATKQAWFKGTFGEADDES